MGSDKFKNLPQDLRVLCVDKNEMFLQELISIVYPIFNMVEHASSTESAISQLKSKRFDIVIINPKMSDSSGVDSVAKIKEGFPETNIIILTSHCNELDLFELFELGITKLVSKPFSSVLLRESLYETARSISDINLQAEYQSKLEIANLELAQKTKELEVANAALAKRTTELEEANKKLEKTINALQVKIEQINNIHTESNNQKGTNEAKEQNEPQGDVEVFSEDLDELADLEGKIDSTISMAAIGNEISEIQIELLSSYLSKYSRVLNKYVVFSKLSGSISSLADALDSNNEKVKNIFGRVVNYMESMVIVLVSWRDNLSTRKMRHDYYDASMISDIEMIIASIGGAQSGSYEEIELF